MEKVRIGMGVLERIELWEGDITTFAVDAIVNAANPSLMGGGGVDGAIHKAAGPQLREECKRIRKERYPEGLPTGEAVITRGYNLPARYVIHTVGPVWRGGTNNEDELLAKAYRSCLVIATRHQLRTIAFPSISTGAYGFPIERAARIALREVAQYLKENALPQKVLFVLYGREAYQVYEKAKEELVRQLAE